jgi:hypothetical protein
LGEARAAVLKIPYGLPRIGKILLSASIKTLCPEAIFLVMCDPF